MITTVRISPRAFALARGRPPGERTRLLDCWRLLRRRPDVDNVTTFHFPVPPLVYRLQHCAGFDTLYQVDTAAGLLVIGAVARSGQRQTLRP